ncbi:hypothetical protein [Micromonospora sp. RP3T]|uniref:hypothetical protein n=1 Tax=Micromonospora sp. RP3T TaxID=2135446 RepID=UPI000D17C7B3|nr:hypothetical protein [Micromonospora sp. RP3T]PTA43268.1 hypothetical protein C8054_26185 [Micromonospora sp. RP3T]
MLDDTVLDHVVRSQVGAAVRTWRHERDGHSPMNVVLDVVDEVIGHPYAVYWVDGDVPEMFSLPGLDPSVVLFNTRYLEMIGHLREIVTARHLSPELMAEVAEQVSLRIIAELALRYGDPGLACHLLVESLPASTTYHPPVTLRDLERTPVGHHYMSVWFYPLLHELGHVHAVTHPPGRPEPADAAEHLDRLIDEVTRGLFAADRHDDVREWRRRRSRPDSLDHGVLREELDADMFSAQVLYTATARVLQRDGTPDAFRADQLAGEILLMFGLMQFMNSCVMVARYGARLGREAIDAFNVVAHSVRLNVMIDFLSVHLASGGRPVRGADPAAVEEMHAALLAMHARMNEQFTAFEVGHARAMRHSVLPEERGLNVFDRLAEAFTHEATAAVIRSETERFLDLARTLDVQHPDLDLLAAFVARPADAAETLDRQQRVFLVPWVTGEGVDQPFGLPAHDELVVFVFATQRAVELFAEECRPMLAPGLDLKLAAFVSPTNQNVITLLFQLLPEHRPHIEVVFQDSDAFTERFRQLGDGTFWPPE